MSWGGAPRCTKCQQAVYHAEQVMGPGRKVYHKLCLKCAQCDKRLDSGGLVEHDGEPYCQRCHTQVFGTRDLRHANVHSPSATPPRRHSTQIEHTFYNSSSSSQKQNQAPTPTSTQAQMQTHIALSPRPRQAPAQDFYTPPRPNAYSSSSSSASSTTTTATSATTTTTSINPTPNPNPGSNPVLELTSPDSTYTQIHTPRPMTTPGSPSIALDESTEITRPNFRADRPISVPYAGGVKALDERGMLMRGNSPRSKVGEKMSAGDDCCWGCEKRVYAAEQVFAIHHKWHRWCLKCNSCRTTLDPSKVSDRDGVPFCKNCYAKEHGPGGIMGKR